MGEVFIKVNNLTKTYNSVGRPLQVLRGVNLELNRGDYAALIGPSGSGKTTFLNMLTAVDTPTSGDVVIDGMDITKAKQRKLTLWRATHVGIVFQFFQLLPTLSVVNNVVAPMDFANVHKPGERHERAMQLLELFDIADQAEKTPDLLSGGQQQRVAIARALANNPALIVADEATANLDRMSSEKVFETLHSYARRGHTVLVVTHNRRRVREVPIIYGLLDGIIERTTIDDHRKRVTQELKKFSTQEMRAARA